MLFKRLVAVLLSVTLTFMCGCSATQSNNSDDISKEADSVSNSSKQGSAESKPSSVPSSSESDSAYPNDDWREHPEDYNLIAFTFDDAPSYSSDSGNATVSMINTLIKYNGSGTLFVQGERLEKNGSKLLKFALDKGFELGNHTYYHKSVSTDEEGRTWTTEQNAEDFLKCHTLVEEKTGFQMKYLRPAGGHTNAAVYSAAEQMGLPCILGNRNEAISDWDSSVESWQIAERILNNSYDGAIILLHGWNPKSAKALEMACDKLYKEGYRFCTLDELFEFKGKSISDVPKNSLVYGFDPETGEIQTTRGY